MPQLATAIFVIRDGLCDQFPKIARVIHFFQMAQFVDNNVVDKVVGKRTDPGVEIKVAFSRATPPPRLHPLDFNIVQIALVVLVIQINPMLHEAQNVFVHTL